MTPRLVWLVVVAACIVAGVSSAATVNLTIIAEPPSEFELGKRLTFINPTTQVRIPEGYRVSAELLFKATTEQTCKTFSFRMGGEGPDGTFGSAYQLAAVCPDATYGFSRDVPTFTYLRPSIYTLYILIEGEQEGNWTIETYPIPNKEPPVPIEAGRKIADGYVQINLSGTAKVVCEDPSSVSGGNVTAAWKRTFDWREEIARFYVQDPETGSLLSSASYTLACKYKADSPINRYHGGRVITAIGVASGDRLVGGMNPWVDWSALQQPKDADGVGLFWNLLMFTLVFSAIVLGGSAIGNLRARKP